MIYVLCSTAVLITIITGICYIIIKKIQQEDRKKDFALKIRCKILDRMTLYVDGKCFESIETSKVAIDCFKECLEVIKDYDY